MSNELVEDVKGKVVGTVETTKEYFNDLHAEDSQSFVEDLADESIAVKDIVSGTIKEQVGKVTDNEVLELKGRLQRLEADDSVPTKLICTVAVVTVSVIALGWAFKKTKRR